MFQKKSHPVKIKINYYAQVLKNQKKKKNRKKRGNVNAQEKKSDNWQCDCPEKEKEKAKNKKGATLLLRKKKKLIMMSLNLRGIYLIYNDVETVWLVDPFPYLQGSYDVYFTDDMAAVSTPTLLLTYVVCYLWKIVPSVAYKLQ